MLFLPVKYCPHIKLDFAPRLIKPKYHFFITFRNEISLRTDSRYGIF